MAVDTAALVREITGDLNGPTNWQPLPDPPPGTTTFMGMSSRWRYLLIKDNASGAIDGTAMHWTSPTIVRLTPELRDRAWALATKENP